MNFSGFIAKKINAPDRNSFSSVISIIAQGSVGIGVFIMLISYAILFGFKDRIQNKLFSFSGHIQLTKYSLNASLLESPVEINESFVKVCRTNPNIANVSIFSLKAGLIKSKEEVIGCVIKGIDTSFSQSYFQSNILSGRFINLNSDSASIKEILMSRKMADKLNVNLNDQILIFFVQDPPRYRKLKIVGIYETGMEEFDESVLIGDINMLRKINNWDQNLAGGYEITVKDLSDLNNTTQFVYDNMDYDLGLEKTTDKYATIFDWLDLLDKNVVIFLFLIFIVASFNMVSSLFIMIMERTAMIGTLKAFGATNQQIIKIFFLNGFSLIIKGLLIGNCLAIIFCYIQYQFQIIPLDPENYYMKAVPIEWSWIMFFIVNSFLLFFMSMVLLLPAFTILKITPIKAIKFD